MAPLPSATVPGEKAASSPVCEVVVILAACILLQFVLNYFGVNNLFSALAPGPYKNVFIGLVLVRVSLWLALPLVCLWWFSKSLNELKRGRSWWSRSAQAKVRRGDCFGCCANASRRPTH